MARAIGMVMFDAIKAAFGWLIAHGSSISSWAAVLITAASTLVAYGVVLPGHVGYQVIGGVIAVLTVLAARSSSPPSVPPTDPPVSA